ncbi:MAG: GNAT family N-acetyltransferase [Clostridia bacterium]|nr:GNAT family N-acetyltransferase [Clostridia bacterium]
MIRQAFPADAAAVAALSLRLWPGHTMEEMTAEFSALLASPDAAVFLAESEGAPVAFAQCQLRRDYVEGATGSPTGYLEGIWVDPAHRRQGIAAQLLAACQGWAKKKGCREFASDCEIDNAESLAFHLRAGFTEASRNIHFIREL